MYEIVEIIVPSHQRYLPCIANKNWWIHLTEIIKAINWWIHVTEIIKTIIYRIDEIQLIRGNSEHLIQSISY